MSSLSAEVCEKNNADSPAKRPSKKQHTEGLRASASASPDTVQLTGLKILLQAERVTNPQSYITSCDENIRFASAASQSLPFIVPAQLSAHQSWSEQTAKWCYDVLDHLQLPREIVYLSMNLLDKALMAPPSKSTNHHHERFEITNKHEYEKMAIASLFLAVRLVSTRQASKSNTTPPRRKLQISELLTISGSSWTVQDIQHSSSKILLVLGLYSAGEASFSSKSWDFEIHQALVQATPHSFCKLLFFGFHKNDPSKKEEEAEIPRQTRLEWLELALYLIELSVCDWGFHRLLPSVIALASLQTASKILQSKQVSPCPSASALQMSQHAVEETLRKAYGISQLPNTSFVGNRLEYIYQQSQDNRGCLDNGGRRTNASTSKSHSVRACDFACPALIVDDEDEEAEEQSIASIKDDSSAADIKNHQGRSSSQQQHSIRHIQSDLDLEALAGRQQQETMMHRPISPCPNIDTTITTKK